MQESWVEGHRSISGGVLWIHSCCGHGRFPCDLYELVGIYPRFKNEFLWCRCRRISRTRGYGSGLFQGGDLHSQVQDGGDKLRIKRTIQVVSECGGDVWKRPYIISTRGIGNTKINYVWETDTDVRVELSSYSTPSRATSTSSSPGTRLTRGRHCPSSEGGRTAGRDDAPLSAPPYQEMFWCWEEEAKGCTRFMLLRFYSGGYKGWFDMVRWRAVLAWMKGEWAFLLFQWCKRTKSFE